MFGNMSQKDGDGHMVKKFTQPWSIWNSQVLPCGWIIRRGNLFGQAGIGMIRGPDDFLTVPEELDPWRSVPAEAIRVCWIMQKFFKLANTAQIPHVSAGKGTVQNGPSSKAAGPLVRGTYTEYVSTTRGRERRWWTFSTAPISNSPGTGNPSDRGKSGGPMWVRKSLFKKSQLLKIFFINGFCRSEVRWMAESKADSGKIFSFNDDWLNQGTFQRIVTVKGKIQGWSHFSCFFLTPALHGFEIWQDAGAAKTLKKKNISYQPLGTGRLQRTKFSVPLIGQRLSFILLLC